MTARTLKKIENEEEYEQALALANELWSAKPGSEGFEKLRVLGVLIEHYEDEHHRVEVPDPIEFLKFGLDQEMFKSSELMDIFKTRSRLSEVLNGKRTLSYRQLMAIRKRFDLPPESVTRYAEAYKV